MRDEILPQAQLQLDEMAAGLARAFSDRPTELNGNTLEFAANEALDSGIHPGRAVLSGLRGQSRDLQTELQGAPYNLTVALAGNDMTIRQEPGL